MFRKLVERIRDFYHLTDEEADKLNPPHLFNDPQCRIYSDDWLPVGYIPLPRTRMGWVFYHLVHGLWMQYPFWKVLFFSLDIPANVGVLDVTGDKAKYSGIAVLLEELSQLGTEAIEIPEAEWKEIKGGMYV